MCIELLFTFPTQFCTLKIDEERMRLTFKSTALLIGDRNMDIYTVPGALLTGEKMFRKHTCNSHHTGDTLTQKMLSLTSSLGSCGL